MAGLTSKFIDVNASADFLTNGAIETPRYQADIVDRLRRRFPFGQRINLTPATGQPSRWFEQTALPGGGFTDPRRLNPTPQMVSRIEQTVLLKALISAINFSLFDVEVNQQQNQFAYIEAKDLSDAIDGILKVHDQALWSGNDTSLTVPTSQQYFGVSGQIFAAAPFANVPNQISIPASGSLVDAIKRQVARMGANLIFEVRPSAFYGNPLFLDLVDREAKTMQLYFNKVEIMPGVIVTAIPTQLGILPFISDPSITVAAPNGGVAGDTGSTYTGFIISEDMVEYHYLTNPLPRVFQMGLTTNLASSYTVVKFGAPVVKGSRYAHSSVLATR